MQVGRLDEQKRCRIGVVAPASRMSPEVAERVPTLARSLYPDRTPEIVFHPQCFASHGHFAGDDETRARAFLDIANDESYDAVWFRRGGYGSFRMVEAVMCRLTEPSRRKCKIAGNSDPLRGDFRIQFRPLLTCCVSVLPFGPAGPGRALGNDWRGEDRRDSTRLF
jgi:hypothetical protein